MDFKSIVLYLEKKGMSATEIHNDIIGTLGPDIMGYSTITYYLRTRDYYQNSTPTKKEEKIKEEEKNQILVENALMNFPFSSIRDIAKITHIPKSTVHLILTKKLHYVLKHLRWIPHSLNSTQLFQRASQSSELLAFLKEAKQLIINYFIQVMNHVFI